MKSTHADNEAQLRTSNAPINPVDPDVDPIDYDLRGIHINLAEYLGKVAEHLGKTAQSLEAQSAAVKSLGPSLNRIVMLVVAGLLFNGVISMLLCIWHCD